jgi:hypothetical protein
MNAALNYSWIWPRASSMSKDESLCFKTSGVDRGDVHWSSQERFTNTDDLYRAMRWVFENRRVLPSLVNRKQMVPDLALEPPLSPLCDGLHVLALAGITNGWTEALNLPVTAYAVGDAPPSLRLLMRLTGANCFLFLGGSCEAEVSVGPEATDEQVNAEQALRFLKSIAAPTPDSPPTTPRG